MNRLFMNIQRCLSDSLRQGGMSMAHQRNVASRPAEVHNGGGLRYQIGCPGANYVNAQNTVCLLYTSDAADE